MRTEELDAARKRVLDDLDGQAESLRAYAQLVGFWEQAAEYAREIDDLGQLERWVGWIEEDRRRVEELRLREERSMQGRSEVMQRVDGLLVALRDLEEELVQRHEAVRHWYAMWIHLAGPGVPKKAPKKEDQETEEERQQRLANQVAQRRSSEEEADDKEPDA